MTTTRSAAAARRRLWWRSVAAPTITLGAAIALLSAFLLWNALMGAGGPVRTWLDLRWHPGAWALTADDFPAGTATRLDVQEAWLTDAVEKHPARYPSVHRLPGMRHLDFEYYEPAPGLMRSGAQVGDVSVFTSVLVRGYSTPDLSDVEGRLGLRLGEHEYAVLDDTGERPAPLGVSVDEPLFTDPPLQDPVHLGDATVTTRRLAYPDVQLEEDGPHGYVGVAGTTIDAVTGDPCQVAAAMALRGEHLVAIGLSAPTTADVDWEAELDRVVTLIDAKMAADPDGNGVTWF